MAGSRDKDLLRILRGGMIDRRGAPRSRKLPWSLDEEPRLHTLLDCRRSLIANPSVSLWCIRTPIETSTAEMKSPDPNQGDVMKGDGGWTDK